MRRPLSGFANLYLDSSQIRLPHPVILADCTPGTALPIRLQESGCHEIESFDTAWADVQEPTSELFLTRLLFPFVDVITVFADDLGGLDVVYALLERWVRGEAATTIPWQARPSVCIIAAPSRTWPAHLQHQALSARLRTIKAARHFSSVRLVCLPEVPSTAAWPSSCTRYLRRVLLQDELTRALRRRQAAHVLFAAHHFAALFTCAVGHVAQSRREPFDVILASRVHRPVPPQYPQHVATFVRVAVENYISFDDVVAVIASSALLDAFPPGAHRFFPPDLFATLYSSKIRRSFESVLVSDAPSAESSAWMFSISQCLSHIAAQFCEWTDAADEGGDWALQRHLLSLQSVGRRVRWETISSNACCITCLMSAPQHPLSCGHAICDDCVPRFGRRQLTQEYSYLLDTCPLCGTPVVPQRVLLKPPTAGVCILNVDGGGSRGVIPLETTHALQLALGPGQRIQDYFDIAFGVSAGGLIVTALFATHWDVSECIERFCRSVTETLGHRLYGHVPVLSTVCELVHSIRTGAVYSAESVKLALQDCFGEENRLFEHAPHGAPRTKFVITATTTRTGSTVIFPNYNAHAEDTSPQENGRVDTGSPTYRRFQRDHPEDEPRLWELTAATSAAPPFFHPVSIGNLGGHQDGGMHNPNPTEIALDECTHVWPSNPRRDLILSLGTGIGPSIASPVGPVTGGCADGVLLRIARWSRSRLAKVLDPQVIHRRVRHTLHRHDPAAFDRYFRLNLDWPSPLPRMDDVTCMMPLMAAVAEHRDDPIFRRIKLTIIASSFFFELDRLPTPMKGGGRWCHGAIRIRRDPTRVLDLLPAGHMSRVRFTKDDDDLAIGHACDWICPVCGRFNVPVRFQVSSTMDPISISLRLGSGRGHHISGFPQSLQRVIEEQRLHDPFVAPPSPPTECVCRLRAKPLANVVASKRAASQPIRAPRGKRQRRA